MKIRTLSEIWVYPVKSLGGYRLPEANVLPKGLAHDRRWMLIDSNNQFLTQRTLPQLALFQARMVGTELVLTHGKQRFELAAEARQGEVFSATVWDDTVQVQGCSTAADQWFSDLLGWPVRFVAFPEMNPRQVDRAYSSEGQWVSLADGYPVLIIGEASLADLNARLATPVPMNRFRPNLVFTNGQPYEEDGWSDFRVGEVTFKGVKPCARCVMTTVDQHTGVKGTEPLATLSAYRKKNGKVYFGQNVLATSGGLVREGDLIEIAK